MKHFEDEEKSGIIVRKQANDLTKELVRKSIHLFACFVPMLLYVARTPVLWALFAVLLLYCIAEYLRINGKKIPVFSIITEIAARKRDQNHFVLGPITLAVGILLTALFFDPIPGAIGIYALALGDGLASLAGKMYGKRVIPHTAGKTIIGSLTCFVAIFISTFLVSENLVISLWIALTGMIIEILPLKDFDNLIIPIVLAAISQFYFHI